MQPLGCPQRDVDVRIVAATNADLDTVVDRGQFRRDLYYRIAGVDLWVPPLRERREDVPILLQHFLGRYSREMGKRIRGLSVSALRLLVDYSWPGNVRELQNEARRLVLAGDAKRPIDSKLLSARIREASRLATPSQVADTGDLSLEKRTADLERELIREALSRLGGNRSGAATAPGAVAQRPRGQKCSVTDWRRSRSRAPRSRDAGPPAAQDRQLLDRGRPSHSMMIQA